MKLLPPAHLDLSQTTCTLYDEEIPLQTRFNEHTPTKTNAHDGLITLILASCQAEQRTLRENPIFFSSFPFQPPLCRSPRNGSTLLFVEATGHGTSSSSWIRVSRVVEWYCSYCENLSYCLCPRYCPLLNTTQWNQMTLKSN